MTSIPLMNAFGLHPTSESVRKFYTPHFAAVPLIYKNSFLTPLPVSSVMFTRNAWQGVDFWNSDADIMYVEDCLSFVDAANTSGNHFDYFSQFLKVYRVASSNIDVDTRGENKSDNHALNILNNFLRADIIWVSSILKERFDVILRDRFSKKMVAELNSRMLVLPYPSFYKATADDNRKPTEFKLRVSSKEPLVFLWNHRLVELKNFKDFFWILQKLKADHPEIEFKILFVCADPEDAVLKAVPEDLHEHVVYHGFVANRIEYQKVIRQANIAIATSKKEGFGSSVFDAISNDLLLFNLDCNKVLATLLGGTETTWSKKDMPAAIAKAYRSSAERNRIHTYNLKGMKSHPTRKEHYKITVAKINEALERKYEAAPSFEKSKVLQKAMAAVEKKPLTKRELYQAVGWATGSAPMNAHWAGYYYGLRREGVMVTKVEGATYYHLDGAQLPTTGAKPKATSKGKLFG